MPGQVAAVTVVNAVVGANPIITDFTGAHPISTYYSTTQKISYGSSFEYSVSGGNVPIVTYQTTDTTNALYKNTLNINGGNIYSLFLCGKATTGDAADYLFTTDDLPSHNAADSTVGIRFVNLSPGSSPISINIQGQAAGSEVNSLAYKSITSFKNYAATRLIGSYVFEFRDSSTGNLLTSFTISGINNGTGTNTSTNNYRYKNITIAFKGLPGISSGSTAQGAFQINNY